MIGIADDELDRVIAAPKWSDTERPWRGSAGGCWRFWRAVWSARRLQRARRELLDDWFAGEEA